MRLDPRKLQAFALNPWVVLASLVFGALLGASMPGFAIHLGVVGDLYVDLMKMIVMPFMVSAIVFSIQRLFQEGGASRILVRVAVVFLGFAFVAALLAGVALSALRPGSGLSQQTLQAFGHIVGGHGATQDTRIDLYGAPQVLRTQGLGAVLISLIPANIFAALADGQTLQAMIFALLFGFAVGQIPARVSDGLTRSLETVYRSCQILVRWLNYPLPVVLLCMSAAQLARMGTGPLLAMTEFVLAFAVAALLALALAAVVLWRRSQQPFGAMLAALKAPFALALATRNSAACMPVMIETLADRLGFARSKVELLVPLSVSLLRLGPVLYFVSATMFIAQLYGHRLGADELGVVLAASVLAGFASSGMSGVVTVSMTGMVCGYLRLPFEAAFLLFVAVDPICDMLRTLVIVVGNVAAVALICPRPLRIGGT